MMRRGLTVVVSPDHYAVDRNMAVLAENGYRPPAVAVLDGRQPPHMERQVLQEINFNRVQLLYTTPEKFASLNFLQMLVHAQINFLAIEDAQYLLGGFSGSYRYWKLWEGLGNLRQRPPLVLLTQPLPPSRQHELTQRLGLKDVETFQRDPAFSQSSIRVRMAWSEQDKFRYLAAVLTGNPQEGQVGRVLNPGSVLIHTQGRKNCQKVSAALHQLGFDPVLIYHPGLPHEERELIEREFQTRRNIVVVSYGYADRFLKPPAGQPMKVLFWQVPATLEELFGLVFQVPENDSRQVEGHVLYTKEDYGLAFKRLQYEAQNRLGTESSKRQEAYALKQVRKWVLSDACRYTSLIRFWHGEESPEIAECGECDRCQAHSGGGFLRQLLRHWVY